MTARQFMRLFDINPRIMLSREDKARWCNVVKDYERFPYELVRAELFSMVKQVGKEKPRFYYVEGVRRRLMLNEHQSYKTAGVAPNVREALKGLFA